MSSIRTSRTRLLTSAAAVALAALSLTACKDDGGGVNDEGAASTSATSADESPESPESASGASDRDGGGDDGDGDAKPDSSASKPTAQESASDAPAPDSPDSSGKDVTCEGSNTKTVAAPLNRPVNHMLLTVTNTGSDTFYLYGYPAVGFGEAQSVPPVIEDSQPQAVVTLQPGQSGYAAVSLSAADGSGSNGRTEKSLSVYFQGRSGSESAGDGARPALPAKGVYVDDSLKVTYWQQSMDTAVNW